MVEAMRTAAPPPCDLQDTCIWHIHVSTDMCSKYMEPKTMFFDRILRKRYNLNRLIPKDES
jgi:hypothetical protein